MKIWFWHKMIIIFGFLGEKCIRLKVLSILSQSEQIYQGLQLSQLYRNLYGEMSFWPQWRHHYLARKLKKFAKIAKKQLLRCGFFVRPHFSSTFTMFIIENDVSSPLMDSWNSETQIFHSFRDMVGWQYTSMLTTHNT